MLQIDEISTMQWWMSASIIPRIPDIESSANRS